MPIYKTDAYLRVSYTEDGSVESDSIANQKKLIEDFVAAHPDIEIVSERVDDGYSGILFDRPAFLEMMSDIQDGKINCVIVKDLSRLGRNAIDAGFYVEKYFPLHHIRFISVNDQYDSEGEENSGNYIIVPLKNMMNESYAADISKKVRAQQHQAMKEGAFVGGRPPYGYKKAPDNCHLLIVNEETAPVVRQIFQWAADGVSLNQIVRQLNENGILCPYLYQIQAGLISGKSHSGYGKWRTCTVSRILADAVYTGDMVQGKTKTVGHKKVHAEQEDWIVVRDTHEPLVSQELFASAQEARREQTAKYTRDKVTPYNNNLLRGRIFCGHCGRPLHRRRERDRYFYRCITNDTVAPNTCRSGISGFSETKLFEMILEIIQQEAETVVGNSLRLKRRDENLAAQKAEVTLEISRIRRETEKNRAYQATLFQNFSDGVLTKTEYMELKEGYNRKISEAAERIQQLMERQSALERQLKQYFTLAERLASVNKDTALTAALVEQVIARVTISGPEDVSIQFRFAGEFENLMEALGDD